MKKLRLTEPVTITGKNYFGRQSRIRFSPTDLPGWFWKPTGSSVPVPLNLELVHNKARRLVLMYGSDRLNIIEHITPLRLTGLDGVVIESDPWPPYHGRTEELWHALKEYAVETKEHIAWCTLDKPVTAVHPKNHKRSTTLSPSQTMGIELLISIDYPDIGQTNMVVSPMRPGQLEVLFSAKSQGYPSGLYYPSRYIPHWMFPWRPDHSCIVWKQEASDMTCAFFAVHRALDLLGICMLADHERLLAFDGHSMLSGHAIDLEALKKAVLVDLP